MNLADSFIEWEWLTHFDRLHDSFHFSPFMYIAVRMVAGVEYIFDTCHPGGTKMFLI